MSIFFAVDPGTIQSGFVIVAEEGSRLIVRDHGVLLNAVMLGRLTAAPIGSTLIIEQCQPMGMPVGFDVMETIFWTGRFFEAWPNSERYRLPRRPIKLHLCGTMQAKDSNVRQALIDKFGGSREAAIGTIKKQGPLYGLTGHSFAALAVAVTWLETRQTPHGIVPLPRASGQV